jgi:hypothetical protein
MKQAELLVSNPKIYQMCCSWLLAIDMPVRDFDTAVRAARKPQGVATPVISSGILEDDGEYEVQQVPFSKAPDPNFTMMGNPYDDFVHGQKHSSKFSAPGQEPPPVLTTLHPHYPQQHRAPSRNASGRSNTGILDDCDEYQHTSRPRPPSAIGSRGYSVEAKTLVTESPAIDTMQAEKNTILAKPDIIITKAGQDDRLGFNQDVVEHELKIARLIEALQTTNTTAKRQKLTKELLELLQSDNSLSTEEEEPTGATQDSATKAIKDETAVVAPLTKTKATSQDSGGKKQPDEARDTAKVSALKLQDPNSTLLPHQRVKRPEPSKGAVQQVAPQTPVETQQAAPRKTPPHLRFVSGRRN